MTLRSLLFATTLSFSLVVSTASAASPGPARLDASARSALVAEIARALETMYVDASAGKRLAGEIRRRAAEGAYESAEVPSDFAARVTHDLQTLGRDKHLAVLEEARHGATMRMVERRADGGGATGGGPGGASASGSPERRVVRHPGAAPGPEMERWKRGNHGVGRVERLEGNVGYLRITEFPPGEGARNAFTGAMQVLDGTDSLIVDLRECPGGTPETVNLLASYFFGNEPIELISRYNRRTGETEKDMTAADLPGRRRPDTDLRILTSAGTGSACESFAYILQQHGRARVVGERTAGAGHLAGRTPIGSGLVMQVSIGRPIHPRTGRGWEGAGVEPDAAVPARAALSTAHREALIQLASRATPSGAQKRRMDWALEAVKARENSAPVAGDALRAYAGDYGERLVEVAQDGLHYRGPGGRRRGPLLAVAPDVFAIDEETRLRFEKGAGGEVTALRIERADGSGERAVKSGAQAKRPEEPPLPDTPAGRRAAAFFSVFADPSLEKSLAFITANHAESVLAQTPAPQRAERMKDIANRHRGLQPRRLLASEKDKIVVLAQDAGGEWLEVTVRVEPGAPQKILGIGLEQSDGEVKAREAPKASDAEVTRAVSAHLKSLAAEDEFSGVVLLARNGKPFFQEAYGLADRERKIPNTRKTRFNIGSIDKTMTQVAIAQLAGEGKLSFTDTIRKHLPDYPSPAADRITIQQLLTMRSGLGDIFGERYAAADKSRLARLSDYLPFFVDKPLLFEPGEGRQYSNAGYVVLGLIIEKLTGREYHDYVREKIRVPAGMTDSGPVDPRAGSGIAIGYSRRLGGGSASGGARVANTAILPARSSSAGGSYATAEDLLRLDAALRADRLLPAEYGDWIFGERTSPPGSVRGRSGSFGVAGGLAGCNATLEMDLERGYTVVVLSNYDPPSAETVARKIREWLGT